MFKIKFLFMRYLLYKMGCIALTLLHAEIFSVYSINIAKKIETTKDNCKINVITRNIPRNYINGCDKNIVSTIF